METELRKKNHKENNKLIILAIVVSLIVGLALYGITVVTNKGYVEMNYTQLKQKMENKETFVLFIGTESCSACNMYKEILNNKFAKEYRTVTIFYIDVSKLTDAESASFNATFDYSVTPTTLVITEGRVSNIDKIEGSNNYDNLIELLKRKGIIKGEK